MNQPLTSKQLNRKTGIPQDTCSYILGRLSDKSICQCLNPHAANSRLYYLSDAGLKLRARLRGGDVSDQVDVRSMDWKTYGWVCFRHRSIVLLALSETMSPSMIKRVLLMKNSRLRINRNNIRDNIRLFLKKGLVEKVFVRRKKHPLYRLTELGQSTRQLLLSAGVTFSEK